MFLRNYQIGTVIHIDYLDLRIMFILKQCLPLPKPSFNCGLPGCHFLFLLKLLSISFGCIRPRIATQLIKRGHRYVFRWISLKSINEFFVMNECPFYFTFFLYLYHVANIARWWHLLGLQSLGHPHAVNRTLKHSKSQIRLSRTRFR